MRWRRFSGVLALATLLVGAAGAEPLTPELAAFRDIYRELVEIDTTDASGDTLKAAQAMAARLKAAGFPAGDIQVITTGPRKGNLVARLRGTGAKKPILLLAHIDVVPPGDGWESEPFKLTETDGYFRGRGVIDDKAMAAIFLANLIEYHQQGFKPERDIIVALTTDEELAHSPHNGVKWLIDNKRELIDAEFALNEGGGGALRNGRPFRFAIQLAEKVYQTYVLEVTDPGGHSASPRRDNPIYRLSAALTKLAQFDFPPRLNAVTRANFSRLAETEAPAMAAAIKSLLAGSTDAQALAPLSEQSDLQRADAHHLRCHAAGCRHGRERAAAARARHRELPHPARRAGRGHRKNPRRRDRRRQGHHHAQRQANGEPALAAASRGDDGNHPARRRAVAGRADPAGHGGGLHRQPLAARRRHSGLRGLRPVQRAGAERRAWPQRARRGASDVYASKDFLYRLVKELASPADDEWQSQADRHTGRLKCALLCPLPLLAGEGQVDVPQCTDG